MKLKGVVRPVRKTGVRNAVRLRLFSVDEHGTEAMVATSALVTKVAAAALCRVFDNVNSAGMDIDALETIFRAPGRTAWASFTAADANEAAARACAQHDIERARGVLVAVTLSPASPIVEGLRAAVDAIHRSVRPGAAVSVVVRCDETLAGQAKVELLLTGCP